MVNSILNRKFKIKRYNRIYLIPDFPSIRQSEATTVIHRYNIILVFSPQSVPVARTLAVYRDPLTGPIIEINYWYGCCFNNCILYRIRQII